MLNWVKHSFTVSMVKIFLIVNVSIRKRFAKFNNNILDSLKMLLCSENELYELNKHKKIRYVLNKADRFTGGQD